MKRIILGTAISLGALPVAAHHTETLHTFPSYAVSCDAASTTVLSREVAWRFGVERSATRGVINVVVSRKRSDGTLAPVAANLDVVAHGEGGRSRPVSMRRIVDGGKVYYVGEFDVADRQQLRFDVHAEPEQSRDRLDFEFSRDFFVLESGLGPVAQR